MGRRFAAPIGDLVHALGVALGRAHEAFVLEHLQGRVDRTRARAPGPAAARFEALDHVVAVARLLGQDDEDGGADVAPPGSPSAPTTVPVAAKTAAADAAAMALTSMFMVFEDVSHQDVAPWSFDLW